MTGDFLRYLELKNILNLISPTSLYFFICLRIFAFTCRGELPGGSVVRPQRFQCGRLHCILGWRTGIPKATQCGQIFKKTVKCVPHIFLESTVTDGSAGRLSILPNVKRSKDLHSSILLSTGASGVSNRES